MTAPRTLGGMPASEPASDGRPSTGNEGDGTAVPEPDPPTPTPEEWSIVSVAFADPPKNRGRRRLGVGEPVYLLLVPAHIEGLKEWRIESGSGWLGAAGGGSAAIFIAPDLPGTTTICATRHDGSKRTIELTIVAPTGVVQVPHPNCGAWHVHGRPTLGRIGVWFLQPDDVAFGFIEFMEGAAPTVAGGYMALDPVGNHPPTPWWIPVGPVGSFGGVSGSEVAGHDHVYWGTASPPPYAKGWTTWNIPLLYRVPGGQPQPFVKCIQAMKIDDGGTVSLEKAGLSGAAALNAPTSSYGPGCPQQTVPALPARPYEFDRAASPPTPVETAPSEALMARASALDGRDAAAVATSRHDDVLAERLTLLGDIERHINPAHDPKAIPVASGSSTETRRHAVAFAEQERLRRLERLLLAQTAVRLFNRYGPGIDDTQLGPSLGRVSARQGLLLRAAVDDLRNATGRSVARA